MGARKHLLMPSLIATIAMVGTAMMGIPAAQAADSTTNPDVELAAFWNSESEPSDTLYMSTNGVDFHRLSTPYQTADNSGLIIGSTGQYTLRDPSVFYLKGAFWLAGGYTQNQNGSCRFTPMLGSSSDLEHWTYPNSGSQENLTPTATPPQAQGGSCSFDSVGTDAMADGNDAWIVTSLGDYGAFHGRNHDDTMKPYIVKASGLKPGSGNQPNVSYGSLEPINLPGMDQQAKPNYIDPSLYKENGTYYLSIKKDGVTNQIYSIADLSQASNASAWTLVNDNVITGYEGPSLTKFGGKYLMYTDMLNDFGNQHSNGVYVTESGSLNSGWGNTRAITTKDENGNAIPNRHGTVITVTDPAAKSVIWNLAKKYGYKDETGTGNNNGNNNNGNNNGNTGNNGSGFTDVNAATPHAEDIAWLTKQGITQGYADGSFGVGQPVQRQDMAAFLYRLAGSPQYTPSAADQTRFTDVNASTPHANEIWWLASQGISTGYVDGTFGVGGTVIRQDMAAFLKRYADKFGGPSASGADRSFTDVTATTPHAAEIAWLAKTGVTTGYPDGTFAGQAAVQRQDMAAFLHRMKA